MHKFFAKTLFLGKKVVFLPECHSTNEQLSVLSKSENIPEGTILWSDYQRNGRGQRGNHWESSRGENLLASVLLKPRWLSIQDQFLLTFISGLAIRESIQEFVSESVSVKWPNDVYVGSRKIAGILTEASISGGWLESAIVGLGINVNQVKFVNQNGTSLFNLLGRNTDREEVLSIVSSKLEKQILQLKAGKIQDILDEYFKHMLGYKEIRTFNSGGEFQGEIVGVDSKGHLKVRIQSSGRTKFLEGQIVVFGLKEISMVL